MRSLAFLVLGLLAAVSLVVGGKRAFARPLTLVPDFLAALSRGEWQGLENGLAYRTARLDYSSLTFRHFTLHVWRFDPQEFRLAVVNQKHPKGTAIRTYRREPGAVLAINGGFFSIGRGSVLSASGLVVVDGKQLSPYRRGAGSGLFYEKNGRQAIGWAKKARSYGPLSQALQVGPMVVDPGGRNGINTNDGRYAKRTVLCQDFRGNFLVVVIDGRISLFDTGKLLSTSEKKGGLGCERALNLDGGPSTMVDFDYRSKSVYLSGQWPVVNALVLKPRDEKN